MANLYADEIIEIKKGKIKSNKIHEKTETKKIEEVNKDLDIINNTNIIEEYNKAIETIKHIEETLSALRYSFKG